MYGRRQAAVAKRDPFDLITSAATLRSRPTAASVPWSPPSDNHRISVEDVLADPVLGSRRRVVLDSSPSAQRVAVLKAVDRRRRHHSELQRTSSQTLLSLLLRGQARPKKDNICDGESCWGVWTHEQGHKVQELIQQGADLELTDRDGNFPLAAALHFESASSLIQSLIEAGANPHHHHSKLGSLMDLTLSLPHARRYLPLVLSQEVIPILPPPSPSSSLLILSRLYDVFGPAVALLQRESWTAIDHGDERALTILTAHGIKLSALVGALHRAVAAQSPKAQVVDFLLEHGCSPDQLDGTGSRPLQVAALLMAPADIIKSLLVHGADTLALVQDDHGRTLTLAQFAADHGANKETLSLIHAASSGL